jgi:hypothetical protein
VGDGLKKLGMPAEGIVSRRRAPTVSPAIRSKTGKEWDHFYKWKNGRQLDFRDRNGKLRRQVDEVTGSL